MNDTFGSRGRTVLLTHHVAAHFPMHILVHYTKTSRATRLQNIHRSTEYVNLKELLFPSSRKILSSCEVAKIRSTVHVGNLLGNKRHQRPHRDAFYCMAATKKKNILGREQSPDKVDRFTSLISSIHEIRLYNRASLAYCQESVTAPVVGTCVTE